MRGAGKTSVGGLGSWGLFLFGFFLFSPVGRERGWRVRGSKRRGRSVGDDDVKIRESPDAHTVGESEVEGRQWVEAACGRGTWIRGGV